MKPRSLRLILLAAATISCHAIHAQSQSSTTCNAGGDDSQDIVTRAKSVRLGHMVAGPAVWLRQQPDPECNDERCSTDQLPAMSGNSDGIEMSRNGSWVCVLVPGKKPLETRIGWLSDQRWKATLSEDPNPNWTGVWQNYNQKLWIRSAAGGQLSVKGDAIWDGRSGPHFGDFEFVAKAEGDLLVKRASGDSDRCEVALRIVGPFIFGADNGMCGAMNVNFNGMYRFRPGLK
jgi:hypothetical protein